jgi:hypothetical protein
MSDNSKTALIGTLVAVLGFAGGAVGTAFALGVDRERVESRLVYVEDIASDHEARIRSIEDSVRKTQNDVAWIREYMERSDP